MSSSVNLVIFEGGLVQSPLEEDFRRVRQAVVIDKIAKAYQAGFERIILCTPYQDLADQAKGYGVEVELDPFIAEEFHFGNRLLQLVRDKQLSKVLYMGGAAAPLISSAELAEIRKILLENEDVVTANNYYSADLIGFTPALALERFQPPKIDNSLATTLAHEAKLKFIPLQRSLGLHFDLDAPGELLTLAVHPDLDENVKEAITRMELDTSKSQQIKAIINDPYSELAVFGRVNALTFQILDEYSNCRVRLYSEERGLKALGRDVRGEVTSLLGKLILSLGYQQFFAFLSEICQGALIDTRVLFAYFRWELTQHDRFCSDLGKIEQIVHSGLREFTELAYNAKIPIMLGGHSLVTGGLWALIESSYLDRVNR